MKKAMFTTERVTPLTMSLLAISLTCAALSVAHEFFGLPLPFAHSILIAGPLASGALAIIIIRKIDWAR